ncbi:MAG: biotin/lipoyl-binding protein, partial [Pseudomonadales bacterium]
MSAPIKNYLSIDALERPGFLSHLVLWCTILVVFVAIVWANFAELDEITRAEGRVIPSSQIQVIQNLEGGILREVLVKEGDQVAKGQVLLQIDDTRFTSSLNESQSKVTALRFRILRLESEISMQPMIEPPDLSPSEQQTFDDEAKLYQSRQEELSSSLSILKQQLNQ